MIYDDKTILALFIRKDGKTNSYLCGWNILENKDIDAYNYLKSRYSDIDENDKVSEILYRIKNNITEKPKCIICGLTKNMFNGNGYKRFCSEICEYSEKGIELSKEVRKNTNIEKFGFEFALLNEDLLRQIRETNIKRYGAVSPMLNKDIQEKAKQTCLSKYGVDRYSKTDECKEKYKQTCLERYGVDNLIKLDYIRERGRLTCMRKYGVEFYTRTEEYKIRAANTLKKNKTLKYSKIEINFYNYLLNKFGENDIILQYKNELYPYHCDFYIKSLDLYIEINGTWTHGMHQFNKNNIEDINKLNFWKSKNSSYYNSAITTWTVLDVKKRLTAKNNNLNYLEIYSINLNKCVDLFNIYLNNIT